MALTKISTGMLKQDAASSDLNIDAGTLYLDVSNNRVGVNNTSPDTTFEVSSSTAPTLRISNGGGTSPNPKLEFFRQAGVTATFEYDVANKNIFIKNEFAGTTQFHIGGTERMRIDSSGNVGIGTASPSQKLDVVGAIQTDTAFRAYDSVSTAYRNVLRYDSGNVRLETGTGSSARELGIWTAGTERIRVDGSGNVGIGTTSPSYRLHVYHATNDAPMMIDSGSANGAQLRFASSGTPKHFIGCGGGMGLGDHEDLGIRTLDNILFSTGGTANERMRINSSGNVGIGTTSPTTAKLVVSGDANTYTLRLDGSTTTSQSYGARIRAGTNSSDGAFLVESTSASSLFFIRGDGNVGIGTNSPSHLLHVTGADGSIANMVVNNDNVALRMSAYTNSHGEIRVETNHPLVFKTNGNNERMRIQSSGNVGIGTTSPDTTLHITKNQSSAASSIKLENLAGGDDSAFDIDWQLASSGTSARIRAIRTNNPGAGDTDLVFSTSNNGTTLSDALILKHDGKVGIGTDTPLQKLSVNGIINSDSDQDYYGAWISGNSATNGYSTMAVGEWYSAALYIQKKTGENRTHIYNYNANHPLIINAGSSAHGETTSSKSRLGIGTFSPSAVVHITGQNSAGLIVENGAGNAPTQPYVSMAANNYSSGYGTFRWEDQRASQASPSFIWEVRDGSGTALAYDFRTGATGASGSKLAITQSGNVGIGTTGPTASLHVQGANQTDGTARFVPDAAKGSEVSHIHYGTNGDWYIRAANSNGKVIINDMGGNVGIGTSSPATKLEVAGTTPIIRLTDARLLDNPSWDNVSLGSVQFYTSDTSSPGARVGAEIEAFADGDSASAPNFNLLFKTATNTGTATEKLRIDKDGRVGIGTISPERALHVVGGIHLPNNNIISWDQANGTLRNAMYVDSGDDMIIGDTNFDDIYFSTGQKTKTVVIKQTTGRVGVGTTAPSSLVHASLGNQALGFDAGFFASANPSDYTAGRGAGITMQNADVYVGGIYGIRETSSWQGALAFYTHTSSSGNTFGTTVTEKMRISSDGNVGIGRSNPDTLLHLSKPETSSDVNYLKMHMGSWSGHQNYLKSIVWHDGANDIAAIGAEYDGGKTNIHFHSQYNGAYKATSVRTMSILGNGNVGIGTSSPASKLSVHGDGIVFRLDGTANTDRTMLFRNVGTGEGIVRSDGNMHLLQEDANRYMRFSTANTERMRLDSSGNLLVGGTNTAPGAGNTVAGVAIRGGSDNRSFFSVSSNYVAAFNRNTNDGPIVEFNKDGVGVGSIGSEGGDSLFIQGGTSSGSGLLMHGTGEKVLPAQNNTSIDATINLGQDSRRFKDLYLSGGAYLGGTASANKLHDYEEGNWDPTIVGNSGASGQSYNIQNGKYAKIGSFIHATFDVQLSTMGTLSGTYVVIGGLPFNGNASNLGGTALISYATGVTTAGLDFPISAYISGSNIYLMETGQDADYILVSENHITNSTRFIGSIFMHEA